MASNIAAAAAAAAAARRAGAVSAASAPAVASIAVAASSITKAASTPSVAKAASTPSVAKAAKGEDSIVTEWNELIFEWMIAKGQCHICALAHVKDGAIFAAAVHSIDPQTKAIVADGSPVEKVYKANYEMPIFQEDGSEKMTPINEPETIKAAADNLRAPTGIWIAGTKYKIVRSTDSYQSGPHTFKKLFCATQKGGCHMIVTQRGLIVIAIYLENSQSLNTEQAALSFAEFLASNNY